MDITPGCATDNSRNGHVKVAIFTCFNTLPRDFYIPSSCGARVIGIKTQFRGLPKIRICLLRGGLSSSRSIREL